MSDLEKIAAKARAMDERARDCDHEWDRDYHSRIIPNTGSEVCTRCGTRRGWAESPTSRSQMPQDRSDDPSLRHPSAGSGLDAWERA